VCSELVELRRAAATGDAAVGKLRQSESSQQQPKEMCDAATQTED
jgi:hypothetical protein